jgi:hypothetical protein
MAKKLLTSDTKLDWIRDTRSGVNKSTLEKGSPKADKPAGKSTTKNTTTKKGLRAEPATKTKGTGKKAEVRKAVKSGMTASKVASVKKRTGSVKTSLVAPPPIKPIEKKTKERSKPRPVPKHEALHEALNDSQANASLSYQVFEEPVNLTEETSIPQEEISIPMEEASMPVEEASTPIEEMPLLMDEIPFSPEEVPAEKKILGKLLYLASIAALVCAAIFLPERYSMLVFLGFIFIALIEVSYRVGEQYHLLKSIAENRNN